MAITSILDLRLKPDSLEAANESIHATLAATRAVAGCLGVTGLVDSAAPAHVVLLESWESAEHDQAYRVWRATPGGASELGSILAAAPALSLYAEAEGV